MDSFRGVPVGVVGATTTAVVLRSLRGLAAGHELGRPPRRPHSPFELLGQLVDRDALLLERVAVADGDRAVLQRLVVDRDANGVPISSWRR